jgi:hypothetical protein
VSWSRRPVAVATTVATGVIVALVAACTPSPPGPDAPTSPASASPGPSSPDASSTGTDSPATSPAVGASSTAAVAPTWVAFDGDLLSLVAAAPPQAMSVPVPDAPDSRADVDAMARTYSYPTPGPYAQRLVDLGYRQGVVLVWRLGQQNFATVRLIQLRDESAAQQWYAERGGDWQGQPLDATTFSGLNLPADFDGGARGTWFVGQSVQSEDGAHRTVAAIFYRHEIVVHLDLTLTDDDHVAAVADFARAQFYKLP